MLLIQYFRVWDVRTTLSKSVVLFGNLSESLGLRAQGGGRSGLSPVPAPEGLQTLWSIINAFACGSTVTHYYTKCCNDDDEH